MSAYDRTLGIETICCPCLQRQGYLFRFIIEYSSLRDFGPYVIIIGLFLYEDFRRMIFWLESKLEINYMSYDILKDFGFF